MYKLNLYSYKLSYKYTHYFILSFSAVENGVFTPKLVQQMF